MKTISTMSFSGEKLLKMKEENLVLPDVLLTLKDRCDKLLIKPNINVTKRNVHADSKNIHDYASIGTYWWPNPETLDGLPYIRKDGITNPLAKDENDYTIMCENVFNLALCEFYFGTGKYAKKCVEQIYDWFLNPDTFMTPHADYSQFIPGVCKGRGIGIIDFRFSYYIFDAIEILKYLDMIDLNLVKDLKNWFSKFLDWLLNSENGIEERNEENNHGTWYDALIMATSIFVDRDDIFDEIVSTCYEERFLAQVASDGSQKLELERQNAIIYSLANIRALIAIVNIAKSKGNNTFMKYEEDYASSVVKKAIDFIYPHALNVEASPYTEIKPHLVGEHILDKLLFLNDYYPNEDYLKKAQNFMGEPHLYLAKPFSHL